MTTKINKVKSVGKEEHFLPRLSQKLKSHMCATVVVVAIFGISQLIGLISKLITNDPGVAFGPFHISNLDKNISNNLISRFQFEEYKSSIRPETNHQKKADKFGNKFEEIIPGS